MDIWDCLVAAGVGLLVFFTPFASGGVEVWATGVAEAICFSIALLWLGKSFISRRGRGGFPALARREFRALALASGAFVGFLLLQLVPLPPSMLRIVSPHSYQLYQRSLPGWPNRTVYEDAGYVHPPAPRDTVTTVTVLPTVEEVKSGVAVPFAPQTAATAPRGPKADTAPIAAGAWRSISVAPILTRAGLIKSVAYAALLLVVVFYRAGRGDADTERKFRRVLILLILASGIAVAMTGLSQRAFFYGRSLWADVLPGPAAQRASGPFVNPDHFANYLAMILPLAIAGALFREPLEPAEGFSGFQLLCAGVALIIAAAILISLSRAGWIEIGLGIVIFAYLLRTRSAGLRAGDLQPDLRDSRRGPYRGGAGAWFLPLGFGLMAVAIAALTIVGPGAREEAGARVSESVSSGVGFWDRIDMWADSAGIVRDYPVFGSGFDSWPTVFPRYQRPPWTMYFAGEAQNDYVEIAAECGIIGMALLGWLCWKLGRFLYQGAHSIPSRHWGLFAALIPALAIMGFHETLDFCMQIPANAIAFVILAGIAMRLARTYGPAPLHHAPGAAAGIAVPAAIGIAAVAGLIGIAYQRETVYPDDMPYPASIRANEAAIASHPASPIPHLWLADRVHDSTGAWLTRELESAIWLDPTNPAGRDRYVQALLSEHRNREALHEIETATYDAPTLGDHNYLNTRLIPWMPEDERAAAERGLRQASAQGFESSTGSLTQLYLAEGRQLEVARRNEAAAQSAANRDERFDDLLSAGDLYAKAGKLDQAERDFKTASTLIPDDARPYQDLITQVYGPSGRLQLANTMVEDAARKGASPIPMYEALFDAAAAARDYELAKSALRQIVRDDPSYANLMHLGGFCLERSEFECATASVRRALELNPQSGEAYFLLAQAEEGVYQNPAARSDYERAIALAPDHPEFKTRSLDLAHKIAEDARNSQ